MPTDILSKSTFMRSMQCQKSLFLYKRMRHLQDKITDEQQAIFSRGHSVGFLARRLFPGGADAGWKSPRQFRKSVLLTQKLIAAGKKIIYEAAFLEDEILIAVDILVHKNDGWHAYEVKSSLSASETFIKDASLQYRVLKASGLNLLTFNLVHVNKNYVRGKSLEINNLFTVTDVTGKLIEKQRLINWGLGRAKNTLQKQFIPDVKVGSHCHNPYPCDFQNVCWANFKNGKTIFHWSELEEDRKWMLFEQGKIDLAHIPNDFPQTRTQQIQFKCIVNDELHIDKNEIAAFVNKMKFPAAFVEINVAKPAIPAITGMKPYEQMPFMFGITGLAHICAEPEKQVYIAEENKNIEFEFVEKFLAETADAKTILVFGAANIVKVLKNAAIKFPELNLHISHRLKMLTDIAEIFGKKHIYHAKMGSNANLNAALAVLGIESESSAGGIKSAYMAGVAFESLFNMTDIFYRMDVRNKLNEYASAQSLHIYSAWKMLREISLQDEPVDNLIPA